MYLIGIVAFMISFFLLPLILKGLPFSVLMNPAAILAILFALVSVLITTASFKLFTRGLNAAISRKYYLPETERLKAAELFRLLSKVSIGAALFVFFAGLIVVLSYLGYIYAAGHAVAAALVSLVLGTAVPIMFFEPAAFILRHRADAEAKVTQVKAYPKALGDRQLELCYQNGLSAEDIEKATEIDLR